MGISLAGAAIIGIGGALVSKKIGGSPLSPGAPPAMPSQASVLQNQQLVEGKDASLQYGRAATVLTGTGQASTTGDRLGP